jgi:hypothetical protein
MESLFVHVSSIGIALLLSIDVTLTWRLLHMKGYYLFRESNMIVQRIDQRILVILRENSENCTDITSKKERSLKSLCTILSIAQFLLPKGNDQMHRLLLHAHPMIV